MITNFRSAVFSLCKELQKNKLAIEIGDVVRDMYNEKINAENGTFIGISNEEFVYLAKKQGCQFHGFLFVDENIDEQDSTGRTFFKAKRLTSNERQMITKGHNTMVRFISLCISDVMNISGTVGKTLSPYFTCRDVDCDQDIEPLLSDDEMAEAVNAFKSGKVYKSLISARKVVAFNRFSEKEMQNLILLMDDEINKCFHGEVPRDLRDLSLRMVEQNKYAGNDILMAIILMIYSLRESLRMACQLMYMAICGENMVALNEENIINFRKNTNVICDNYNVLIQDDISTDLNDIMGSVLIMDCDQLDGHHIHEFGMIDSVKLSFGEFGDTMEVSFAVVNEEMINIVEATQTIMLSGILE